MNIVNDKKSQYVRCLSQGSLMHHPNEKCFFLNLINFIIHMSSFSKIEFNGNLVAIGQHPHGGQGPL